jgi:ATP-dependent Lhr-like helicase
VTSALNRFSTQTRTWFEGAFSKPTPAQDAAWDAISTGAHTLVVAPTGSGKTLAAFLWAIDRLAGSPVSDDPRRRTRVLYISPMKALAVDVERNLRAPLTGVTAAAVHLGRTPPAITVAIRSGDTPANERQRFQRHPTDILITTPESLYLLLTSRAREVLQGVETVIVDEVHAVAGTKRGAHLALSLERLDALLDAPAQRIGLSATVRPVDAVARFLGGRHDVRIVQPDEPKPIELEVVVPVEDLAALDSVDDPASGQTAGEKQRASVWPHVESRIVDLVAEHRSTIVFANSRRLAERLSARLNEEWFERSTGDRLPAVGDSAPAQVMAQSGATRGHDPSHEIARAHHGSVSREQRQRIEEDLKQGLLPAVVATSSLELGIDMGAVDLVIQVESPPSVASGVQRVGRADHRVDGISRGIIFPKHRGDLVPTAVTVERMRSGDIESLSIPHNPLDVLAQHIVAMVAMDEWSVVDLAALVGRAAPFQSLPPSVLDAVLDMLAGRYPSDAFAELRPRLVWDREHGVLTARPGAQRLAVTSGGTIPDRGLSGAAPPGGAEPPPAPPPRVGELDEEMVYESRVGDVFALGATSWRIEDITHDRVLVSPAPGQPGRLPFWHGDTLGRPAELGRAIGAFTREVAALAPGDARSRVQDAGLDEWATDNVLTYLAEQREACGHLPDDHTVVVERFRDEIGDWRLVIHSPFGGRVNTPWSLAIADRIRDHLGIDVQVMPSDDGIVMRLPDIDAAEETPPPVLDYLVFDADEIEESVTRATTGSALFAARFRECAARALLLPRRRPDRRTPLWQQRQRAAQLLSVAGEHAQFPIVLETLRECLQDVFDLPALRQLMTEIERSVVRVVEVETAQPSPFARSLLFSYVGAFLYEGDAPLAERRAQALALDSTLLAELMGQAELRELLDADALEQVEQELQRLTPDRSARNAEDAADMLRVLGPLTTDEAAARGVDPAWLDELAARRRVVALRMSGRSVWAAVEDVSRLRDAIGVPPPMGLATAFLESVADPVGDLVSRYARTHGPFTALSAAGDLGLGVAVVEASLRGLADRGRVVSGEFRPGGSGTEWCDSEVLRLVRRRSLAVLRREVEPVEPEALARFLPAWQDVGAGLRGVDGVHRVVEQLQGAFVPASTLESLVLPARIVDYSPTHLDELLVSGEVRWAGRGSLPGHDGWVTLTLSDSAPALLPDADETTIDTPVHQQVLAALEGDAALFFRALVDRVTNFEESAIASALWDLVWAGAVSNDTMTPLRSFRMQSRTRARTPPVRRARYARPGRPALNSPSAPPHLAGRWSLLPSREPDVTSRAYAVTQSMLDRYGVVTRGAVMAERRPGGFAATYRVLTAMEETGRARRGYFVEGLGGAQFGHGTAIDRLRATSGSRTEDVVVLAATDPAQPYGAALPWPSRSESDSGHQPGRKAGSLVVLVGGRLGLYVERGGRSLLSWLDDDEPAAAVEALAAVVRRGALGRVGVERVNGADVRGTPMARQLQTAGFRLTPRGLRLSPQPGHSAR